MCLNIDYMILVFDLSKSHSKYLSKTERERFDALASHVNIKESALALGIEPSTLYCWLWAIRKRFKKTKGWCNAVISQTKRGKNLSKLLHVRKAMLPPDSENEEDAEEYDLRKPEDEDEWEE